jgi:S-disulfanyl-L-cysteine oxidoreductase SoxD
MNKTFLGLPMCVVVLLASTISASVAAQDKTIRDGVFTIEQATAGKQVYEAVCKNCHDLKYYEGTLKSYNSQPLIYLWENLYGTMPADNPGSLSYDEYTNVVAYILAEYKFPAGDVALNPDLGMDKIKIVTP